MKAKVIMVSFVLTSFLMLLPGCGRKGPPTLPKKPSSLTRIEQEAQLPGCHLPGTWGNGIVNVKYPELSEHNKYKKST